MGIESLLPAPVSTDSSVAGVKYTNSLLDDASKKIRKPYTITKSRQNWTDVEHDKFLEALHLFDRDWKKIEAFVGSKTAIQHYIQSDWEYALKHGNNMRQFPRTSDKNDED